MPQTVRRTSWRCQLLSSCCHLCYLCHLRGGWSHPILHWEPCALLHAGAGSNTSAIGIGVGVAAGACAAIAAAITWCCCWLRRRRQHQPAQAPNFTINPLHAIVAAAANGGGRQNVHDPRVEQAVNHNLQALGVEALTDAEVAADVAEARNALDVAAPGLDARTRADALQALDGLGDGHNSVYNTSERRALAAVWRQVRASTAVANLTETLGRQLASAIEGGSLVCSGGRIARIVGALAGAEELLGGGGGSAAVPSAQALREEIANLAVQVRKELGDGARAAAVFAARVREQYVTRLNFGEEVVQPLIDEFRAGFD